MSRFRRKLMMAVAIEGAKVGASDTFVDLLVNPASATITLDTNVSPDNIHLS